jgi:membrane-associated phospholipid phosphatase
MNNIKTPKQTAAKPPKPAPTPPTRPALKIEEPPEEKYTVRWGYVALMVVGIIILACAAAIASGKKMTGWEHTLFVKINGAHLPGWVANQVAKPLSNAVWGIVGLAGVMLAFPKYRLMAWQYVVAGAGAFVFEAIIEQIVGRGRPEVLTHDVILRAHQGGAGFPSGHVSVLATLCLTMWTYVSWPWRVLLVLFVGAEAWARLYLGVHSPLDIIGAIGVAFIVVSFLHLLPLKLRSIFRIHA